ncbi:MAG: hypothetical protein Q3992_02045 [Bacteroides sp.]|nr:hypothetical protein [Bacteroides sp.]
MKKIVFLIATMLISISAFSQEKKNNQIEYHNCKGFENSIFKSVCEEMTLSSEVKGKITFIIEDSERAVKLNKFWNGKMEIDTDEEYVYDCSHNTYSAEAQDGVEIELDLYAYSNDLHIEVNDVKYSIITIDGGCDTCIKNLKIEFKEGKNKEIMTIEVLQDIVLENYKKLPTIRRLVLLKGSKLEFHTKHNINKKTLNKQTTKEEPKK